MAAMLRTSAVHLPRGGAHMTSKRDKERGERRGAESREREASGSGNEEEGLSNSTQRAKWIDSVDEHEDRPGQTLATRNHDVICRWAEERRANPATVSSTEHGGRAGVLRFDFPGFGGENLEE